MVAARLAVPLHFHFEVFLLGKGLSSTSQAAATLFFPRTASEERLQDSFPYLLLPRPLRKASKSSPNTSVVTQEMKVLPPLKDYRFCARLLYFSSLTHPLNRHITCHPGRADTLFSIDAMFEIIHAYLCRIGQASSK